MPLPYRALLLFKYALTPASDQLNFASPVAIVPQGTVLAEGLDSKHEKINDADSIFSYNPLQGNILLAIVHHVDPKVSGGGCERAHYALVLSIRK